MSEGEFRITQKEAADFLQVSTKSISRYRKRGLPHQFILNPVTGKQEVRFRRADLERWHEGRQLLATYGRDGEEAAAPGPQAGGRPSPVPRADDQGFLNELLAVYREEIEILRDQVEDLRERAQQARVAGDAAAAGDALNQALLLVPEDPAVLQERAEVALLQGDYARADTLAQRAFQLGSQVGPLCRMHWETVRQVRQHALAVQAPLPARHTPEDAAQHAARAATMQAAIADAESRRDACTVPVIERM